MKGVRVHVVPPMKHLNHIDAVSRRQTLVYNTDVTDRPFVGPRNFISFLRFFDWLILMRCYSRDLSEGGVCVCGGSNLLGVGH